MKRSLSCEARLAASVANQAGDGEVAFIDAKLSTGDDNSVSSPALFLAPIAISESPSFLRSSIARSMSTPSVVDNKPGTTAKSSVTGDENDQPPPEGPIFAETAFYFVKRDALVRRQAYRLITWKWFERFSIFVIVVNCAALGSVDPCDIDCATTRCRALQITEHVIFAFFFLEMLAKMLAMGVVGERSYLAETWNRFDCFIVVIGLIEYMFVEEDLNISAIRAFRVLRPLRAITRIPSLRLLILLLLDTMPMLGNVLLFCCLVFFIFGIAGVQLLAGVLRHRCFFPIAPAVGVSPSVMSLSPNFTTTTTPVPPQFQPPSFMPLYYSPPEGEYICTPSYGVRHCSEIPLYEEHDSMCDSLMGEGTYESSVCREWVGNYTECRPDGPNPHRGSLSFDNIGAAWMAIFQTISLEGWTQLMYLVQDAYSFWVWIYFVTLIIAGSFFAVNLCLVVIATQFSETKRRETEKMRMERKASMGSGTSLAEGSFYTQVLDIIVLCLTSACSAVCRCCRSCRAKPSLALNLTAEGVNNNNRHRRRDTILTNLEQMGASRPDSPVTNNNWESTCSNFHENQNNTGNHKQQSAATENNNDEKPKSFCAKFYAEIEFNRMLCRKLLEHNIAAGTIIAMIILNSIAMGVEHHGQPEMLTAVLDITDRGFTCFFTIEVVVKIYAYGFPLFVRDALNLLDLITVSINVVELMHGHGTQSSVSVLRTFRLLRVLKIVRFLPSLQRQLYVMLKTIDNIATFFILLSFFLFISALLGMSLFGCRFCPYYNKPSWLGGAANRMTTPATTVNASPTTITPTTAMMTDGEWIDWLEFNASSPEPVIIPLTENLKVDIRHLSPSERNVLAYFTCPRANFDSLLHSLFTVLQVFTQDAWSAVLIDGIYYGSEWAGLYFIALVTIGNYVIFNLLVAILVEGFSTQGEEFSNESKNEYAATPKTTHTTPAITIENCDHSRTLISAGLIEVGEPFQSPSSPSPSDTTKSRTGAESPFKSRFAAVLQPFKDRSNYSLFLLPPNNFFRKILFKVVTSSEFDNVILAFILANCFVIMLERPAIKRDSVERQGLDIANYVFNGLFLVEAMVKIVAKGFVIGPNAYLKSGWNVLDFFLVICSTVYTTLEFVSPKAAETKILEIFRVLRLLRALRPLRVVNRAPGLKIVVETLLLSVKPIGNVIIICLTFFIIFSILGVQLFQGCFYQCEATRKLKIDEEAVNETADAWATPDPSTATTRFSPHQAQLSLYEVLYTVRTKDDCIEQGFDWVNEGYNFDNIFQALMALFVFATFDGWVDITRNGIDCVGVDMQPIRDYNPWNVIYFISFLLIVCFFILNMFVGVVVHNFQKVQERVNAEFRAKRLHMKQERLLKRLQKKSIMGKKKQLLVKLMRRKMTEEDIPVSSTEQLPPSCTRSTEYTQSSSRSFDQRMRRPGIVAENLAFLRGYSYWRLWTYHIFTHKYFEIALAAITALNILVMAVEFYQMPRELQLAVRIIGYVFTGLLVLEVIAKMVAFGVERYISDRWNRLDIVIVGLSIAAIFLEDADTRLIPVNPTMVRVARIVRIARVFKLLKTAAGIRRLLDTVGRALPQVGNLSLFFALLFFIYASLGVEIFGKFECTYDKCEGLSRHASFQNFGMALLTLFRIFTGDDWNGILKDMLRLSKDKEECRDLINAAAQGDFNVECTMAGILAPFYFVSFVLLAQFVLINVVVAVLMGQLEESHRREAVEKQSKKDMINDVDRKVDAMEDIVKKACPELVADLQAKLGTTKEEIIGIISTEYVLREEEVNAMSRESSNLRKSLYDLASSQQMLDRHRSSDSLRTICLGDRPAEVLQHRYHLRPTNSCFLTVDQDALVKVFHDIGEELKPFSRQTSASPGTPEPNTPVAPTNSAIAEFVDHRRNPAHHRSITFTRSLPLSSAALAPRNSRSCQYIDVNDDDYEPPAQSPNIENGVEEI